MLFVFKNNNFLLNKSLRNSWHIYMHENIIYYDVIDSKEIIRTEKLVNDIDIFDVAVDIHNNVHVLYLTNTGELYYLAYNNNEWEKELIKKINISTDRIDFLKIIAIKNDIHIFYSFQNTFVNQNCNPNKLYLLHLYNNGIKWRYRYLITLLDINKQVQFFINTTINKEILFFYSINTKNKFELNYNILSDINLNWKGKKEINLQPETIKILNLYVDSNSSIHFIYKNKDDIRFTYHTSKELKNISKDNHLKNLIYCDENRNIKYNLFEFNNKLFINWKDNENVHYKISDDYGLSWSEESFEKCDNGKEIKLIGNIYKDMDFKDDINVYGTVNKGDFYLFGIEEKSDQGNQSDELDDNDKTINEGEFNSFSAPPDDKKEISHIETDKILSDDNENLSNNSTPEVEKDPCSNDNLESEKPLIDSPNEDNKSLIERMFNYFK